MSKHVDWSFIHGAGTILCDCDQCNQEYEFEFEDGYPDYRECQKEIEENGWISKKVNGEWMDFCCEECCL